MKLLFPSFEKFACGIIEDKKPKCIRGDVAYCNVMFTPSFIKLRRLVRSLLARTYSFVVCGLNWCFLKVTLQTRNLLAYVSTCNQQILPRE
jgi:hypothetical protein